MTAIAHALGTALLEFIWQGLLGVFLLWTALFVLQNRSARARYLASCVGLAVMALLPVVNACLAYTAPGVSQAAAAWASAAPQTMRMAMSHPAGAHWAHRLVRWAVPAWALGVLLFALRLVWASRQISALRRQAKPAEAAVLAIVSGLQERMKLARPVRVLISAVADCPSVIGWIRPAVLLPAATVLGLTQPQLEAVLAHELAHILRYDYLVNMLQTVIETLLFYHPAVWWASARVRQERELCCDDMAVDSCGDALCYARALTRLERLRVTMPPRLALGSAGGPLLYRIRRLVGDSTWQRGPSKLPGILALTLGLLCFALTMQWARGQQPDAPAHEPAARVDLGGARVVPDDEVEYPDAAIEKGIQGTVVVEATIDADGMVSDARVLNGPPELRKAALQSVLEWHFTRDAAGSTRQISIVFQLPTEGARKQSLQAQARVHALVQKQVAEHMAEQARTLQSTLLANGSEQQAEAKKLAEMMQMAPVQRELASAKLSDSLVQQSRPLQVMQLEQQLQVLQKQVAALGSASVLTDTRDAQIADMEKRLAELQMGLSGFRGAAMMAGRRLKIISTEGLTDSMRDDLVAKLPVQVGDILTEDSMEKMEVTLKQFGEHLDLATLIADDGEVEIRITVSSPPPY